MSRVSETPNKDLERVQYSYAKLPETYKIAPCSARKGDAICKENLNDKYVGIPPHRLDDKASQSYNPSKQEVLKVAEC